MIRKTITAALLLALALLCACGAGAEKPGNEPDIAPDRRFFYQNTQWGMTLEEIEEIKGAPDERSDELKEINSIGESDENTFIYDMESKSESEQQEQEDAPPAGYWDDEEAEAPELIDFFYYDKTLYDKYTVAERFLFDAENKLEGVTARVFIGEANDDLTNLDELVQNAENTYVDIKDILTKEFGPPAAEYTAYTEEGEYKTKEELDLQGENSFICTSRWDGEQIGENVRFIYIVYYLDELRIDIRYTYHSKEMIDRVDSEN